MTQVAETLQEIQMLSIILEQSMAKNWQRELVIHLWAGILKQMEVVQKFLKLI